MKLVKKLDPKDGIYEISPAEAAQILESRRKNRPLSEPKAREYASDIASGNWICNGETIIVNGNGELIDGQHRLRACVIANKPITSYVVHGLGTGASEFDSLDQGRVRTGAHRLALEGVKYYALQSAVTTWYIRYQRMLDKNLDLIERSFHIRPADVRTTRAKLASVLEPSCLAAVEVQSDLTRVIGTSIASFIHMMGTMRLGDRSKPDAFLVGVSSGANLTKTNAALVVRNTLLARKRGAEVLPPVAQLALTIKAWNAFQMQQPMKLAKWDASRERFPRFIGD